MKKEKRKLHNKRNKPTHRVVMSELHSEPWATALVLIRSKLLIGGETKLGNQRVREEKVGRSFANNPHSAVIGSKKTNRPHFTVLLLIAQYLN